MHTLLLQFKKNPIQSKIMVGECCVTEQYVMLGVLIGLSILLCAVWRFPPLKPLKLFAVLLHESGHAGATVLSCGKVESIEVHGDEGGVTKHRGGKWWCVLPAGYVGGAVFGSAFIIASGSPLGSVICCGVLALILLFVLCYARSWWAFGLAITTVILMGAAVALYLFKVDTRAYFARIVIGIAGTFFILGLILVVCFQFSQNVFIFVSITDDHTPQSKFILFIVYCFSTQIKNHLKKQVF